MPPPPKNATVYIALFPKPYCPKALYMLYKHLAKINDIVQCTIMRVCCLLDILKTINWVQKCVKKDELI